MNEKISFQDDKIQFRTEHFEPEVFEIDSEVQAISEFQA